MRMIFQTCVLAAAIVIGAGSAFAASTPVRDNRDNKGLPEIEPLGGIPKPQIDKRDMMLRPADRQRDGNIGDDPLLHLTESMSDVAADLTQLQTDKPVQTKQASIVGRLNELIRAMEEQQKQRSGKSGNRSGSSPTKPLQDSKIMGGPGGEGDMHAPKTSRKDWGDLPPKQREQILQSKTEGFPPGFESVLQSYYRRLAQEKVVEESNASPPTTQPSTP